MKLPARAFLFSTAAFAAILSAGACAQDYPQRSVRLVIPFPPGGATDGLARVVGQGLTANWGHQIVVDNRPGAGGNIGAMIVAKAPPDGYTLFMVGLSHAANLSLYRKLDYHPLRDFTPITQVVSIDTFLAVHPSLPVKSVKELLALARAKPGSLNYASGGNGSSPHMAMELFKSLAKVDIVHVPYKGTESVIGLMRGEAGMIFENLISIGAQIKSGKLRALAIGSPRRSAAMPDIPTVSEAGVPGYAVSLWFGMLGPAGLPKPIVDKAWRDTAALLKNADVRERFASLGADPIGSTPDEFTAFIKTEIAKWEKVIRGANIQVD
ncbi:MAG: tripartite tricarboxylate transporter substrate binding protein [Rhodocyclaceae bacterium]|nr:tripartite tricarboxylate transporter substrate binding protein [Rhodocyclaceae bacterium]MCA3077097.1 tripartite tricarboxylate transporter substrate binding protein [Rhodocyclaceae bacterium]MCA3090006.1 tripartite tricarboxylate transporter substrate binding protein [Rhodocyclaceae bacterium]MCA3093654.1 tripartite tricarboxylate transporter substrate binding protein [Rhodocyclaceae bacterium]MCA3099481.1 tripartite tricarboxylate transporter substrate binding protein [Rhodocyclaceae bact